MTAFTAWTSQRGQIVDIGVEADRAGGLILKGASAGAVGLGTLAAAGLAAYAALKAVEGVIKAVLTTMASSAAVGRLAAWAGVTPEWMTKVSGAAFQLTNAPQEQTQAQFYQIQQDLERVFKYGEAPSERLVDLQRAGIDAVSEENMRHPESILEQLLQRVPQMELPEAQARLRGLPACVDPLHNAERPSVGSAPAAPDHGSKGPRPMADKTPTPIPEVLARLRRAA
jgi:hypothetical protein